MLTMPSGKQRQARKPPYIDHPANTKLKYTRHRRPCRSGPPTEQVLSKWKRNHTGKSSGEHIRHCLLRVLISNQHPSGPRRHQKRESYSHINRTSKSACSTDRRHQNNYDPCTDILVLPPHPQQQKRQKRAHKRGYMIRHPTHAVHPRAHLVC